MKYTEDYYINYYCDESCHLENDESRFMILGMVYCWKKDVDIINKKIEEIKKKNGINPVLEIKWRKLSKSKEQLYMDLLDYFLDENSPLSFRALVVDKKQLNHKRFNQTHEEFYYKMYYYLLERRINKLSRNKVYVDERDTNNAERIKKLEEILHNKFRDSNCDIIAPIQIVKSHRIQIMELADILIGAISYAFNVKNSKKQIKFNESKIKFIEKVENFIGRPLNKPESYNGSKFELFYFKVGHYE